MELLGTLLPSFKFKECFRKAFVALIPERCFVFQVLPLLNSEWDALLWHTTGLLFFWSIFKLSFFCLPEFFPHGDLGLGSWLHLRLLMQLKSAGKSSVLGSPWYGLQFVSLLIRELCQLKSPHSPCLLCCNPHAMKNSLQGGINPPLFPIQT